MMQALYRKKGSMELSVGFTDLKWTEDGFSLRKKRTLLAGWEIESWYELAGVGQMQGMRWEVRRQQVRRAPRYMRNDSN
jgi:hypothetical protein